MGTSYIGSFRVWSLQSFESRHQIEHPPQYIPRIHLKRAGDLNCSCQGGCVYSPLKLAYIFFTVPAHRSHLVLFETESSAFFYKDSGERGPDNRISPVWLLPRLAALLCHERPHNENLYRIVPGTILSVR